MVENCHFSTNGGNFPKDKLGSPKDEKLAQKRILRNVFVALILDPFSSPSQNKMDFEGFPKVYMTYKYKYVLISSERSSRKKAFTSFFAYSNVV